MKRILYSKSFLNVNMCLYAIGVSPWSPWFLINIYPHIFCMHEMFFSFLNPILHFNCYVFLFVFMLHCNNFLVNKNYFK